MLWSHPMDFLTIPLFSFHNYIVFYIPDNKNLVFLQWYVYLFHNIYIFGFQIFLLHRHVFYPTIFLMIPMFLYEIQLFFWGVICLYV